MAPKNKLWCDPLLHHGNIDYLEKFKKLDLSQLLLSHSIRLTIKDDIEDDIQDTIPKAKLSHLHNARNGSIFAQKLRPIRISSRATQQLLLKLKQQSNYSDSTLQVQLKNALKLEKLFITKMREETKHKYNTRKEFQHCETIEQDSKHQNSIKEFEDFKTQISKHC